MFVCYFVDGRKGFFQHTVGNNPNIPKLLVSRTSDNIWMIPGTVSPLDD